MGPRHFELSTDLDASVDAAWAALIAIDRWHEWNRLMPAAAGRPEPGQRLALKLRREDGRLRDHRPVVVAVEPPEKVVLAANFGHRWLLRLVHSVIVEERPGGARIRHRWDVSGLLTAPLWASLTQTFRRFDGMSEDLRQHLEAVPPPPATRPAR